MLRVNTKYKKFSTCSRSLALKTLLDSFAASAADLRFLEKNLPGRELARLQSGENLLSFL